MTKPARIFLAAGAITAFIAVALGAFGAHALSTRLAPDRLAVWHTAVEYHFWHALGLLAVGSAAMRLPDSRLLKSSGWAMLAGIVLFSGGLYAFALSGERWAAMGAPAGGIAFLAAWALFAAAILKN